MIDLYTWTTPNGRKVSIMLEETGLDYHVLPVDLQANEQAGAEFLAVCPNGKIPAIVDHDTGGTPLPLFESGAILLHLAEKTGRFLPGLERPSERARVVQWLMYQMSHVGPMIGQAGHFVNTAEDKIPYAIERFVGESMRIVGVLNNALADSDYLAGDYSIADMATYPWIEAAWEPFTSMSEGKAEELAALRAWMDRLAARPAVARGMAVGSGN